MFETETFRPCLVWKLKWGEGKGGAWSPCGYVPAKQTKATIDATSEILLCSITIIQLYLPESY